MTTVTPNPWQQIGLAVRRAEPNGEAKQSNSATNSKVDNDSILFILDAANQVEENCLREWLKTSKQESDFKGDAEYVVVPIARDENNIPTDQLRASLTVSEQTIIVPTRVVWKSKLDNPNAEGVVKPRLRDLLTGNPRHPSAKRAQKIINEDPSRAVCVMGVPATLEWLNEQFSARQKNANLDENIAEFVASQASLALDIAERRLRGSRYRVPTQVARSIQVSERFKRGLQDVMNETGETEAALRQKAIPIYKELIATPHIFWKDVMAVFNRWVIGLGYESQLVIDKKRLNRFRKIVREHPTALLWTHKTHIDGIAMQNMLFENDFPTPHTMGGINMAMAGIGSLARKSGAIFIRRSFSGDPLYKLVLRNYLSYLLEKRFPLTWSFEGTRSRLGKLMPPRYGMLKYVMDAIVDSNADKLYVIPVAINYDMINDVKDYVREQSGGVKRPESLSWLISYLRRLRRPLGRIYVDFGEPVVIDQNDLSDDPLSLTKTALKVGFEANRVTPITLTSLMCLYLLGTAPRAQTIGEMSQGMVALRAWAKHRDVRLSSDFKIDNQDHMQELIDAMVASDLIVRYDEGPEVIYALDADQHATASYYRNTIVHHFVTKAIVELAIVHAAQREGGALERFWDAAERFKDLFKFEFFYAPAEDFHQEVIAELDFIDADWETKFASQPRFAANLLKKSQPLVAHATLLPYVEAYRVVLGVFAQLSGHQTLDEKATVVASFKFANQAYLQRRISSRASIAELLFKNAYKSMESYDLLNPTGDDVAQRRKKASRRIRTLCHQLEYIRIIAIQNDL